MQHRLIPPVRLTTMTVSRDGVYMAGGTPDGRIFLWEVSLAVPFLHFSGLYHTSV